MKVLVFLFLAVSWANAIDSEEEIHWSTVKREGPFVPGLRIVNGQPAAPRQFPYQVGLFTLVKGNQGNWCGGSLISRSWILSAAHCVDVGTRTTAYLGSNLRQSGTAVTVSRKIIHSGWNPKTLANDICLLGIPAVTLGPAINIVRLPALANSYPTYVNQIAITSGWGATGDTQTGLPRNLQYAELRISENSVCSRIYNGFRNSNICIATPQRISTCGGDSGGPLVIKSSRLLVGVTSFGAEAGCSKGFPIVFTRVTSYRTWIRNNANV